MNTEITIDSGMGFCWAAVPDQPEKRDYKKEIGEIIDSHFSYKNDFDLLVCSANFRFYVLRLANVYKYGLVQGRELVKMICRCAFNDSSLTDKESICIIETCHDPRLDYILLEVNYNACW